MWKAIELNKTSPNTAYLVCPRWLLHPNFPDGYLQICWKRYTPSFTLEIKRKIEESYTFHAIKNKEE